MSIIGRSRAGILTMGYELWAETLTDAEHDEIVADSEENSPDTALFRHYEWLVETEAER